MVKVHIFVGVGELEVQGGLCSFVPEEWWMPRETKTEDFLSLIGEKYVWGD